MAERRKGIGDWLARNRQVIAFCLLLLFITWGLFFWQTTQDRQATLAASSTDLKHLTASYAEYVTLSVASIDNLLRVIKAEYEAAGRVTPGIEQTFRFALENPYINNCAIINAAGYPVASSLPAAADTYIGDVPHFTAHTAGYSGRPYISQPYVGRISGKLSIFISRRLNNPDGSFAGVVSINVRPEYFTKFFNDVKLAEGNAVRVIGLDGVVRASQSMFSAQEIGLDIRAGALFKVLPGNPAGSYYSEGLFFGMPRYFAYRTLLEYPLIVQVGETVHSVLAPFEERRRIYFVIAATLSLFILAYTALLLQGAERRHQAESRYRALMDQSSDAIAVVDPATLLVLEINPRFTELLGYGAADLPRPVNPLMNDDEDQARAMLDQLMADGQLPPAFRTAVTKAGSFVPVERVGTLVTIDGKPMAIMTLRRLSKERILEAEIAADAALARRIQQALLPKLAPSPYVDVATYYRPLRLVSGDTFSLEWAKDGTLLRGYLVDVTGHGVATALQTAALGVLLHQVSEMGLPMVGQLAWLNCQIPRYFQEDAFAAAIIFELDLAEGQLRYAGAGITELYYNGSRIPVIGSLLGLGLESDFQQLSLALKEGDIICFLTDGLGEIIRGCPEQVGRSTDEAIAAFEQVALADRLADDVSAICLKIDNLPPGKGLFTP